LCYVLALALAGAILLMIGSTPATAQDINPYDYFQFRYEPVTFDKSVITQGGVFHATITGSLTCTKDLPVSLPVSGVIIVSQVVAEHTESGAVVNINPSYTTNVSPFPSKEGETTEISLSVPLQFPAEAEPGDYNVIGKINEVRIKLILGSLEITSYFPPEQPMGTVEYAPAAPTPTPAEHATKPDSDSTPGLTESTKPPTAPLDDKRVLSWWSIALVVLAITAIIFFVVRYVWNMRRD
jgi:hypothetical protein